MGFRVIPDYPSSRPTEQVDLRPHVEIVSRSEPPSVVPPLEREAALASQAGQQLWVKLKSKLTLAALAAILSMLFFLYLGDRHDDKVALLVPSSESIVMAPANAAVSSDTLTKAKDYKIYGFDALMEAKESAVVNEARTFSYFDQARLTSGAEFSPIIAFKDAKTRSALTTHLSPILGNSGRFRSSASKLEWQGGFASNNPAANTKRASEYLKYLERKGASTELKLIDQSAGNLSTNISIYPKASKSILFHEK